MKILMLTQWFQPEPFFKGLPFAKSLQEMGHEVEVLTGFPNYPGGKVYPGYRIRPWQTEIMDGIKVNRVALYPSHDNSGFRRILNYISFCLSSTLLAPILTSKPDVIYVYNLVTLGPAAFLLRFLKRCPVVIDVQDLWPESVATSGMLSSKFILHILSKLCNYMYKKANYLTVLSPGFKRILCERGVDTNKIEVIYNWCDEDRLNINNIDTSDQNELTNNGKFNIVFAGTMGKMQALEAVLGAAELLKDKAPEVLFTFIGGGIEVNNLQNKAAEMGLSNVQFLPRRPLSEMCQIFRDSDALLVHLKNNPLFNTTIPSKIQAYLCVGKPIIVGVSGDASDLIDLAGAGLSCEPENPESIAQTVLLLARMDKIGLKRMANNGRDFYFANLSFNAGVNKFYIVFSRICKVN